MPTLLTLVYKQLTQNWIGIGFILKNTMNMSARKLSSALKMQSKSRPDILQGMSLAHTGRGNLRHPSF